MMATASTTELIAAANSLLRTLGVGVLAILFVVAGVRAARVQDDELDALNRQIVELFQAGKYAQATPMAERA